MIITGDVLNAVSEQREMTNKQGVKALRTVFRVLLQVTHAKGGIEICNVRSYDPSWTLPKVGSKWDTPPVRRYECFDGQLAEVLV